jgi:hypothetical protein
MPKDCLYCSLQYSDTTNFCPNCGRPTESGFIIRPAQESEVNCLRRQLQEKDELIRQLVLTRSLWGEASRPAARSAGRRRLCGSDGRRIEPGINTDASGSYAPYEIDPYGRLRDRPVKPYVTGKG